MRGGGSGSAHPVASAAVAFLAIVAGVCFAPAPLAAQHEHHVRPPAEAGSDSAADAAARTRPPARAPRTIQVRREDDLAAALSGAVRGDTVRVRGAHHGDLRIDVPLLLAAVVGAGTGRARLVGSGEGTTLTVAADSVEVRGFHISGSGISLERDDAAVKLLRCEGCRIVDNRIDESLHGIYLLESNGTRLVGNDIEGIARLEESQRGNGIHLYNSAANRLERNRVRRTRDGIYFSFASDNEVSDNDVADLRYGLHYMYSDDNRFRGNRFERNAAGAAIMFSKRIEFRGNVFSHHTGPRAFGILLQTSQDIVAEQNRIEGNRIGLFMDNATRSLFA
ncbi:MAG: NosD domain-containing protein, partial [Gemmatimonadota bacterium]